MTLNVPVNVDVQTKVNVQFALFLQLVKNFKLFAEKGSYAKKLFNRITDSEFLTNLNLLSLQYSLYIMNIT